MERLSRTPALVRPEDLAPGRDVLVLAAPEETRTTERPWPFAALTWRLLPDGRSRTAAQRRSHGRP